MSFNLKRFFRNQYLVEDKLNEFEKNKWIYLTDEEKEEFADDVFDMIDLAYKEIGGHPNYKSPQDVMGSEKDANYMVIDLDDDPEFDAVKISKDKSVGKKLVGMGHDGSSPAKSAAVNITALLLKKPGHFVEVSGKLKDILQAKGAPIIKDEEMIRKVLKGKEIEYIGDGSYKREIGGKMFTKMLMGKPTV